MKNKERKIKDEEHELNNIPILTGNNMSISWHLFFPSYILQSYLQWINAVILGSLASLSAPFL